MNTAGGSNLTGTVTKNLNMTSPLAQGNVSGYIFTPGHTELNYQGTLHLLAGETLDLVVDVGAVEAPDNVGIQATITMAPVPEPSTFALLAAGLVGLLVCARRKSK